MRENKGITLIALVITIIIMLILAGVTINLALGENGLIGYARNAKEKTEAERDNEQILANGLISGRTIDEWVNGGAPAKTTLAEYAAELAVGDTITGYDCVIGVNANDLTCAIDVDEAGNKMEYGAESEDDQTFTATNQGITWKVLGIENGQILITTAEPIDTSLILGGQEGYVNGPDILNRIGALYGHGALATGGRSINVNDVNRITGYNPANDTENNPDYGLKRAFKVDNGTRWYKNEDDEEWTNSYMNDSFTYYNGTTWPELSTIPVELEYTDYCYGLQTNNPALNLEDYEERV